jgi:hypothetical protein
MSVKITYAYVPGKAIKSRWFDARVYIHAESSVENMGIAMCYIGEGNMYVRQRGTDETYTVKKCGDRYGPAYYRPGTSSACTSASAELQYMYTATDRVTLDIIAGYIDVENRVIYITDEKRFTIEFEKPPLLEARDLIILAPVVAVPTGIGVATKRAELGAGIGITAAGAYIGYKLYKYYKE